MESNFTQEEINEYCQILELEGSASWEAIQQAYQELSILWHPDRIPVTEAKLKKKARKKIKEIDRAYQQLELIYSPHTSAKDDFQINYYAKQKTYLSRSPNWFSLYLEKHHQKLNGFLQQVDRDSKKIDLQDYVFAYGFLFPGFILYLSIPSVDRQIDFLNIISILSISLAAVVVYYWGKAAVIVYIYQKTKNRYPDPLECFEITKDKIFQLFFSDLYSIFCIAAGMVLLLFPGIYFAWMSCFNKQAIVLHNTTPIDGIKSSWSLLKKSNSGVGLLLFILNIIYFLFWLTTLSTNVAVNCLGQVSYFLLGGYLLIYSTICYARSINK
jgi:hypothetical protein